MKEIMFFIWLIITVLSGLFLLITFSNGDVHGMRITLVTFTLGICTLMGLKKELKE